MKSRLFALALAGLTAGAANAADPAIVNINSGYTFSEYTGTAAVGAGNVDVNSTLYFIDEKEADGLKSWYIFFDPKRGQNIEATIHFDGPISNVLRTKANLDATNATYGIDVDGDGVLDDYTTSLFIGLEPANQATWSAGGHDLYIKWSSYDPGDHIRVLTAVPEPSTYALLAAGLMTVGLTRLRRRRQG